MAEVALPGVVRPRWWRVVFILFALAVAGLLSHAQAFLIDWTDDGVRRVAVVTAGAMPWVWAVLLPSVAVVLGWAIVRARLIERDELISAAMPLGLLLLWAVPFLPGLADRWPLLLLLSGPVRLVILVIAIALTVWQIGRVREWLSRGIDGVGSRTVVAASLVAFVGLGAHTGRVQGIDGDEPHYLMIAQSLWADGDLAIENNYAAREFAPFTQRELRPPFLRRGLDGVIYSVHAPGLPVLLLPAYAAGGARGAIIFLGFVAALAALGIYRVARELAGHRVALAVWAGVALGTPFLFHGWLIYPEMPAACISAWAVWWMLRPAPVTLGPWFLRGLAIASLPWLHTKFAVLAAGFGGALGLWLLIERRWKPLLALSLPMAVSTASWFAFFWVLYGVADPTMPYGGTRAQGESLMWANVPRGTLGLAFDQEFGLLLHSPVYALAPFGLLLAVRQPAWRWPLVAIIATLVVFVVSSTRYYMWWGGASVPARFLVPVLPLLAVGLAVAFGKWTSPTGRALATVAVAATVLVSGRLVAFPSEWLAFNERDGSGKLVEWFGQGPLLVSVLPTLLWRDWQAEWPGITLMVGVGLVTCLGAWLATRRPWHAQVTGAIVGAVLAMIAAGSVLSTPLLTDDHARVIVRAGRYGLIDAFDGRRSRLVDLRVWRRVRAEEVLTTSPLVFAPNVPQSGNWDLSHAVGPIILPPGRFSVRVTLAEGGPEDGTLAFSTRFGRWTLARADPGDARGVDFDVTLPAEIRMTTLWVVPSSVALAERLERVDVTAVSVVPRSDRGYRHVEMVDRVDGVEGAYVAHLDRAAFPEGGTFWTLGEAATNALLYPGRASGLIVWLQAGATGGRVDLDVGPERRSMSLEPWQTLPTEFAMPGVGSVPIRVAFDGGFRPSDVDTNSRDTRWLGVRVRFELVR